MAHHADHSITNSRFGDHAWVTTGSVYHTAAPPDLASRKSAVLKSLLTSPYEDRKNRNPTRVAGTCEWFRAHHLYRQWREAPGSSFLWVSADPGCGKSVLARFLVDEELRSTETSTTCYFFFKDDFEDQRSATSALKCLIHQLLQQRNILFSEDIVQYFESRGDILLGSIAQLWKLLLKLSRAAGGEIVCVFDAYDECDEADREEFTKAFGRFLKEAPPDIRLKVLLTSRPYGQIRQGFQEMRELPGLPILHLAGDNEDEVAKIAEEISLVIGFETAKIGKALRLQQEEEELLRSQLLRNPNRTYLWVYLTMDLIRRDLYAGKSKIRTLTSQLSQSVDEVYDKILSKSSDQAEARRVLHMVLAASRPLKLEEMAVALAVREHHRRFADLEKNLLPPDKFRDYLRDLCGLFITVRGSRIFLLHQTAKEFLMASGTTTTSNQEESATVLKWKHSIKESHSNGMLAHACIWYLLLDECFDTMLRVRRSGGSRLKAHVFLQYSAAGWCSHYRRSSLGKSDCLIRLFNGSSTLTSRRHEVPDWFKVHWAATSQESRPGIITPLMAAAHCGILAVAKDLFKKDPGAVWSAANVNFGPRRSPLSLAAEQGHHEIISLFLSDGNWRSKLFKWTRTVDAKNEKGRTALMYAAMGGHTKVVDLLLKAGARVDCEDDFQGTPLTYAFCSGDQSTLELILSNEKLSRGPRRGPEKTIEMQLNAMASRAVMRSKAQVLRMVLDSGRISADALLTLSQDAFRSQRWCIPNPDIAPLISGQYPRPERLLHLAAARGDSITVEILLDHGADVDGCDEERRVTALHWAVSTQNIFVCRLLLDNNANPHISTAQGKYAVQMETTWKIWALLVERNGLPLSLEYREATRLALLGSAQDLNPLLSHDSCPPSLSVLRRLLVTAVVGGNSDTLSLLLELDNATGPSIDRSKLLDIALGGFRALYRDTIPVLLKAGADLKSTSRYSRTLWDFAFDQPSFRLTRVLLAHGLDPNSVGFLDGTPVLKILAENGQKRMAQLLIEAGADKAVLTHVTWGGPIDEPEDTEPLPRDDRERFLINHGLVDRGLHELLSI